MQYGIMHLSYIFFTTNVNNINVSSKKVYRNMEKECEKRKETTRYITSLIFFIDKLTYNTVILTYL